jgi:WD40 repeat protein
MEQEFNDQQFNNQNNQQFNNQNNQQFNFQNNQQFNNQNNQQFNYQNNQQFNYQNNQQLNDKCKNYIQISNPQEKIIGPRKNSIHASNQGIYKLAFFNSNKAVSVSKNLEIKIWDENFNCIQTIENAHSEIINYVTIIDNNTFATCSADKSIRFWKNENNTNFNLFLSKKNAHRKNIGKIIYSSKKKILISCSLDKTVKIWKIMNNNDIQCITQLSDSNYVKSILLIEDDNILISSGFDGTRFWKIGTFECIYYNEKVEATFTGDTITKINKNKFVFGGGVDGNIQILYFNKDKKQGKLLKEIYINFECFCVKNIDKKYFLVGGWSYDILVFNSENYFCVQVINDAHSDNIKGFSLIQNNKYIVSYSYDGYINIWNYKNK